MESKHLETIRKSLHDLAQPLAVVTGLVDLLLLEMDEHDPVFYEVRMISEQLEKALQIIGEVRRIAREGTTSPGNLPLAPRRAPSV